MFGWNISAVGFWIKGQVGYGTILIEIYIHPELNPFQVKVQAGCEAFHIDEAFAPCLVSLVYVIVINSEKESRMRLG
jgi:hypothetical protein